MIAILEPRCYDGDSRKFAFDADDPKQFDNFEQWIMELNDGEHFNYIVYWVTPDEYKENYE